MDEKIDAIEFISRMIKHIPEEQFNMIQYYEIYAQNVKRGEKQRFPTIPEGTSEIFGFNKAFYNIQ